MHDLSPEALDALAGDEDLPEGDLDLEDRDRAERLMWAYRHAMRELNAAEKRWADDLATLQAARDEQLGTLQAKVAHFRETLTGWHAATLADQEARGVKATTTIKLNGGTLTARQGGLSAVIEDEDALAAWLILNGHSDAVTTATKIALAPVKKLFTDDKPVTEDGELIPGVTAHRGERTFSIKDAS